MSRDRFIAVCTLRFYTRKESACDNDRNARIIALIIKSNSTNAKVPHVVSYRLLIVVAAANPGAGEAVASPHRYNQFFQETSRKAASPVDT